MLNKISSKKINSVIFGVLIIVIVFVSHRYLSISSKLKTTEVELLNRTELSAKYQHRIVELEESLVLSGNARENLSTAFQNEINQTQQSLQNYEKLIKTDTQLLQKYSKVFFLNENYTPSLLVSIDNVYLNNTAKLQQIHEKVWPNLKKMLDDARLNNLEITVVSAYRSFVEQSSVKAGYGITYGAGTANQFSADQGYSEHQLGTTVDFNLKGSLALDGFEKTPAYLWLLNNAYRYGFVLSYPKGNIYYRFEPWHWRFVGLKLAEYLHDSKNNFYDLDQREINKYLINIFD